MMILFALAPILALAAQVQSQPGPLPPEIIVNAARLDAAHRDCVAGKCTTLRDAQVSIALAEQYFRTADYRTARRTLAAALSRNKDRAATDPVPVAALYEAYGTVAVHDGNMDAYRWGVARQVRTIRGHLPPDDPAALGAAVAMGDMWLKRGDPRSAEQAFRAAERQAEADGQPGIAAQVNIRRILLAEALGDTARADRTMRDLMARPVAAEPGMRSALKVLRLRIAAQRADDGKVDALVAELGRTTLTQPVLLWQPLYTPTPSAAVRAESARLGVPETAATGAMDIGSRTWADIGFWVKPDGRTGEIEVLRGSPSRGWTRALVDQIAGRRYSAVASVVGDPGTYRVERFTQRGTYAVPTGKLVRVRSGPEYVEVLDLTEPAKVTAAR